MTKTVEPNRKKRNVAGEVLAFGIASWRTVRVERFDREVAGALRYRLANVSILGDPLWAEAVAGNPKAAVSVALRLTSEHASGTACDLAMTALVACAAEGSEAACLVMSYVLGRMPNSSRREARLAAAWLARCSDGIRKRGATR